MVIIMNKYMNSNTLTGATLKVYNKDSDINLDLSPIQLDIICKILGIHYTSKNTVTVYSDETLLEFLKINNNPLKLK